MIRKAYFLFINITLQWMCFATQTVVFVRIQRHRMSAHVFAESMAWSAVECSVNCLTTSGCQAASFSPSTRECQLCNESPLTNLTVMETDASWNTYSIQAPCEPPWVYYDKSCYWMETTKQTLDNSFNFCGNLGADLLEISSSQKNAFVASAATAAGLSTVWLTLNDKAVEGAYVWLSGEAVVFTEWGANEGGRSDYEDCVMMTAAVGTWHDVDCGRNESPVCEKRIG